MPKIEILDLSVTVNVDSVPLKEYHDIIFDDRNENTENPGEDLFISGTSARLSKKPKGASNLVEPVDPIDRPRLIEVSKYIEAISEKEFSVEFSMGEEFPYTTHTVRVEISLDGKIKEGRRVNWKSGARLPYSDEVSAKTSGGRGNQTSLNFYFSDLDIVDEAPREGNEQHIGKIIVSMWRIVSSKGNGNSGANEAQPPGKRTVGEKSIKKGGAVSHHVGLRTPTRGGRGCPGPPVYVDGKDNPFARFCFKYRSKRSLQALGVLPFTPFEMRDPGKMTSKERQEAAKKLLYAHMVKDEGSVIDLTEMQAGGEAQQTFMHPGAGSRNNPVILLYDDDESDDNEPLNFRTLPDRSRGVGSWGWSMVNMINENNAAPLNRLKRKFAPTGTIQDPMELSDDPNDVDDDDDGDDDIEFIGFDSAPRSGPSANDIVISIEDDGTEANGIQAATRNNQNGGPSMRSNGRAEARSVDSNADRVLAELEDTLFVPSDSEIGDNYEADDAISRLWFLGQVKGSGEQGESEKAI